MDTGFDQPVWGGLPNPHALGQQAAQTAGIKPVAPPPSLPALNAASPPAAPTAPAATPPVSADEPTWASTDTAPAEAAPAAVESLRSAPSDSPAFQNAVSQTRAAQDAILSAKVAAVKTALGGQPFDPVTGLDQTGARARMGLMANTVDRAKYLQDNLPAGSDVKVLNVPGIGPVTVFKRPGDTAYHPIRGVDDTWGRMGDVIGAAPSVATQLGTAIATDGATLIPRLFVQALAGGGERGLELLANQLQGYDTQSGKGDAADMARSAAAADAGELGGATASYVGRSGAAAAGGALDKIGAPELAKPLQKIGATLPGIMKPTAEGEERLAAEARLRESNPDLTPLSFDQLGHPLAEAKGQRLRAISGVLPNLDYARQKSMGDMLSSAATPGGTAPAIADAGTGAYPGLQDVLAKLTTEAKAPLASIPTTEQTEGGRALAQIYQNAIAPVVNRTSGKYGKVAAEMADAPEQSNGVMPIDLTGAHALIDKEAAPIIGQGVPAEVTKETPVMGAGGLGEPVQLGTKTETSMQPTEVRTGGGISPQIQDIVSRLRALNPVNGTGPMTERTASPYEALGPLRSKLSETSRFNPLAPGSDRAASAQAGRILSPLDTAIENAAGPAATSAKSAKQFEAKILDNPQAVKVRETASPESNMALASPENASFLANTQRLANATGQGGLYKVFQNAVGTQLSRQPEKIPELFDKGAVGPTAFNRLLTPESQPAFQQYAENIKNLKSSLATKVAAEPDFAKRASLMAEAKDMGGVADILDRAGGVASPMADNTRAAFYQKMLADSTDRKSGQINMSALARNAGDIAGDPAASRIFSGDDLQRIKDIQTFADGASSTEKGTGSSIMASEVAGKMSLFRPDKWPSLIAATLEAKLQSHLYTADRAGVIGRGMPTGILPRSIGVQTGAYEANKNRQEPGF